MDPRPRSRASPKQVQDNDLEFSMTVFSHPGLDPGSSFVANQSKVIDSGDGAYNSSSTEPYDYSHLG